MKGLLFILGIFGSLGISAQTLERSAVSSAGNEAKAGGIELSSTVGEVAIQTQTVSTLTITQGYQQSFVAVTDTTGNGGGGNNGEDTTSIAEFDSILDMSLYPNPTHSSVNFMISVDDKISLEVFDAAGKLVHNEGFVHISGSEQSVSVQDWENGIYHFRFTNDESESTSYRVVKQ